MNLATTNIKEYQEPKVIDLFDTDSHISFIGLDNITNAILNDPRFEQKMKEFKFLYKT